MATARARRRSVAGYGILFAAGGDCSQLSLARLYADDHALVALAFLAARFLLAAHGVLVEGILATTGPCFRCS